MERTVFGIGYWDNAKTTSYSREYKLWHGMLRRCYDEKYHKHHKAYSDCIVSERWHSLKNFIEDLPKLKNYNEWIKDNTYQLDKDFYGNSKLYSIENCCFLSKEENMKKQNKCKAIVAINSFGEETLFTSIMECERFLMIPNSNISKVLTSKRKTAGGYRFEYVEVD